MPLTLTNNACVDYMDELPSFSCSAKQVRSTVLICSVDSKVSVEAISLARAAKLV